MTEILTESFCERCGTRYTFESGAPRAARLTGIKVLSRGLKNFVLSDDTSMDEAMAAARSETDRRVSSQQLDAFHKTFNFCMSCRQYTCGNCWNEVEGRCLSCAPHLGHDIMPAAFGEADGYPVEPSAASPVLDPLAWPTSDRLLVEEMPEASAEVADEAAYDLEPVDVAGCLAGLWNEAPPEDLGRSGSTSDPAPAMEVAAEAPIDQPTEAPTDHATAAAHEAHDADGRAIDSSRRGARFLDRLRSRPRIADAIEVTEPIAAQPEPEERQRPDVITQPTWRIVAPDAAPAPDPAAPPAAPAIAPVSPAPSPVAVTEPQWPTQPEWPNQRAAASPAFGRAASTGGLESLWAESAREVVTAPAASAARAAGGVQPCVSCGLSLSATARFCRRCGTRQA